MTGGVSFASFDFTAAVDGTVAAIAASRACGVADTEALTFSYLLSSGMALKSLASAFAATNCQGPAVFAARNQRPEMST